jgi:hypothetical protein
MFKNISELFSSGILNTRIEKGEENHVLKSTKLEKMVYSDVSSGYRDVLADLNHEGCMKLDSFKALPGDMFQALYSMKPSPRDESELTTMARRFNRHILKKVMDGEDYRTLKMLTEGRELESIEAGIEFSQSLLENLNTLLKVISGEKDALKVLDRLCTQAQKLDEELADMLKQHQSLKQKEQGGEERTFLEKKMLDTANRLASKKKQVGHLEKAVDENARKNNEAIEGMISIAVKRAGERAEEVSGRLSSWGSEKENGESIKTDIKLLERVRGSGKLKTISKYLGRYREIVARQIRDGYSFGLGEKYDIEYGNRIGRLVSSEYSLLCSRHGIPLFVVPLCGERIQNRYVQNHAACDIPGAGREKIAQINY